MTSDPPAAFVFDAYGTLFDVHSVAVVAGELAPGLGDALSRAWRATAHHPGPVSYTHLTLPTILRV